MQQVENELYTLDDENRKVLMESAPLMDKWSKTECRPKDVGGMEEWAKTHKGDLQVESCDWYHGTWQYLRLLNMVATPPWYTFYNEQLSAILRGKPDANVLISAAADYGMAATLSTPSRRPAPSRRSRCTTSATRRCCHPVVRAAPGHPDRDASATTSSPAPTCRWARYDLIVTDEFLTVLKAEYKPSILKRWKELLKPGGRSSPPR